MTLSNLESLFLPHSVAVIGASPEKTKVGAIVLNNLLEGGFKGNIYPINPKYSDINGLKCYPHIEELPEAVDVVLIAIPAAGVLPEAEAAGKKGVKNVVIYSAGFKEVGGEGVRLEEELKSIAIKYQVNIVGPNCLGLASTRTPLNATFGKIKMLPGTLRFISQSGALATSLFDWFQAIGLGFSDFVSLGNKGGLTENDFLEYWLTQENPGPIGIYLESIAEGKKFLQDCRQLSLKQPVFLLKPGKSKAAAHAMKSHTGSIAGEDSVLEAVAAEAGIIRCSELEDFFDYSRAFAWSKMPKGPNVAIVSNAGGPAVLTTDSIENEGLKLASFSEETEKRLAEYLPRTASLFNPVDILGDALADRFVKAAEIVLQENTVDAVVVILTPQLMTQIAETAELIGNLSKRYEKPVVASFIGGGYTMAGEAILNKLSIPTFRFPERAIKTLSVLYKWEQWRQIQVNEEKTAENMPDFSAVTPIIEKVSQEKRAACDPLEAEELLRNLSIKTPESRVVTTFTEAKNFWQTKPGGVVIKLASPFILHKSEVGGVIGQIKDEVALEAAWNKMQETIKSLKNTIPREIGIELQEEIPLRAAVEVIVGIKRDPTFGPIMLFGMGGKLVELIADKNLCSLPLNPTKALGLIKQSKVYKILAGYRGGPTYPVEKLVKLMVEMGQLVEAEELVSDLEINPVIVTPEEIWGVDAKILVATKTETVEVVNSY